MSTTKRVSSMISKLIRLTQSDQIEWQRSDPPHTPRKDSEEYIDFVYLVRVANETFRLSEYRYKYYSDEFEYNWESGVALEITDLQDRTIWRAPNNPGIYDLFKVAVRSTVDLDGIMKALDELEEEQDPADDK